MCLCACVCVPQHKIELNRWHRIDKPVANNRSLMPPNEFLPVGYSMKCATATFEWVTEMSIKPNKLNPSEYSEQSKLWKLFHRPTHIMKENLLPTNNIYHTRTFSPHKIRFGGHPPHSMNHFKSISSSVHLHSRFVFISHTKRRV